MIGDSWQLHKYSLLGHWAVHCAEPPGPWHTCKVGRSRGGGGRWGWVNKTENRRGGGAGQEPTGEQRCTCQHRNSNIYRWTESEGDGGVKGSERRQVGKNKGRVIADKEVTKKRGK